MQAELQKIKRELKIRNYSPKAIKSYLYALQEYFLFKEKDFSKLDQNNIKNFLFDCEKRMISAQSRNLYLNAIKFYYKNIVKNLNKIEIYSAKKPKKLPIVLSIEEIKLLVNSIKNKKHKILISLAYGTGLRVSEVVNLQLQDLSFTELTVHVKQAKGQKDRISVLSPKLLNDL